MSNSSTRYARWRYAPSGRLELSFPYHASLVSALKDRIPHRYRSYDPDRRVWEAWGGYEITAIAALRQYFPDARQGSARDNPPAFTAGSDHFRVLHLRETAPIELIEASYRVLARLNHPDAGGSHEAMQAINGAYAALRERVGA